MMDDSILTTTKKVLGIAEDYEVYDPDIILHINSTFSTLQQLGVGPDDGFFIEDSGSTWDEYVTESGYNMVKSYICLKVQLLFDPPGTSFLIAAREKQIAEFEWRISTHREWMLNPFDPMTVVEEVIE